MSLHGDYDNQNIFAKIIRGEIPCYKLYEDDDVLAFLDVFPQSFGHSLVIPKRAAARNLLEVDADSLAKVITVVQMLTKVLVAELQPAGVQVAQFNGAPAGQTVRAGVPALGRHDAAWPRRPAGGGGPPGSVPRKRRGFVHHRPGYPQSAECY